LLWHCAPAAQLAAVVQLVPQAVALQRYGAQVWDGGVTQAPLPLQVTAPCATPLAHEAAAPQLVPAAGTRHCPAPLQVPSLPQGGLAVQRLSLPPALIEAQVPLGWPVRAFVHAVQAPLQAVLQQTPSTQKPLAHSCPPAQVCPAVLSLRAPAATQPQTAATARALRTCRSSGISCIG
jgi:hypothetical protein